MTVIKYIKKKNKIFKEATGITLVPKKYIKEVPVTKPLELTDGGACPYCVVFYMDSCEGCPLIALNGVNCDDVNGTYRQIKRSLRESGDLFTITKHPKTEAKIQKLINRFNKKLKD